MAILHDFCMIFIRSLIIQISEYQRHGIFMDFPVSSGAGVFDDPDNVIRHELLLCKTLKFSWRNPKKETCIFYMILQAIPIFQGNPYFSLGNPYFSAKVGFYR